MNSKKIIRNIRVLILSGIVVTSTSSAADNCNWSGLYLGGFAGGSTGSRIASTEPLRLDNNANWFRPFHESYSFNTKSSFIGGLTIGYNFPVGCTPFCAGLEGEYGYINLRGSSIDPNQFPYAAIPRNNLQNSSKNSINIGKTSGYGFLGLRVLYTPNQRINFYFKSGAFFTRIRSKFASVKTEDLAPVFLNLSGPNNIVGYGLGGGIEFMLPFECFSNVSTKIEYLFLGINKRINVYGHCSCNFTWRMTENIRSTNTIKIGINYYF